MAEGDCSDEGAGLWRFDTITLTGNWSEINKEAVRQAVVAVAMKIAKETGGLFIDAFETVFGNMEFAWDPDCTECGDGAYTPSTHKIVFGGLPKPTTPSGNRTPEMAFTAARNNVVHELGHAFGQKWWSYDPESGSSTYSPDGPYASIPGGMVNNEGFQISPDSASLTWRQHPCTAGDTGCGNEVFADMFLGWTFDSWEDSKQGRERDQFMTTNMSEWVSNLADR